MTLDQIEYFITTTQCGSFTKAASLLHISQPALSMAIQKLESELGVPLFESRRKKAVLSPAGHIFLEDCQALRRQHELALSHMRQFSEKDKAELRIAYTASLADQTIPDLLEKYFQKSEGRVRVYADEMPSDRIASMLRDNQIDLGLCSIVPKDAVLERYRLTEQPFCLIVPKDDSSDYENPDDLRTARLLGYHSDYPMHRSLVELFETLGVSPDFQYFGYSESSIARLVKRNLGIAIVADIEGLENYNVRVLHPSWLNQKRELILLTSSLRPLSQAAAFFLDIVCEHFHLDLPPRSF